MSMTVGIFENQDDAGAAIDRLDGLGLDEGSIHVVTRAGAERGGDSLVGVFARAFRGGDGAISSELTRLGIDAEEAAFYEQELDEESILLAVESDDEDDDAVMAIMREGSATLREA